MNSYLHQKSEKEAWKVASGIQTSVEPYYEEVPSEDEVKEENEFHEEERHPCEGNLAKRPRREASERSVTPSSSASGEQAPVSDFGELLAEVSTSVNTAKQAAHQAAQISERAAWVYQDVAVDLGVAAERLHAIRVEQAAQVPMRM